MSARPGPEPPRSAGVVFTPPALARRLAAPLEPALPVLDPSCGEGELLLAAFQRARAAGVSTSEALAGLHGLELDPHLAARTRERLARAAGCTPDALDGTIRCCDALDTDWPKGTWILANPPWAALSGRESRRLSAAQRERAPTQAGWPSLQGPFLERIAAHVTAESTGARVLISAPLVELERYGPLRSAVTARARLAQPPEELGETAFPGVIAPTVLLTLAPAPGGAIGRPAPWLPDGPTSPLIEHLAQLPRLPDKTFADPGVHTGNASAELIERDVTADRPGWSPVREGRCLQPFHLGPPTARLRTDLERTPERRFRIKAPEHYAAFGVLLRQTADRPIAALHTEPTYFRNSLLAARAVEGLDPAFVVAVLNGPVAAAWHRRRFRDARQRAFPQVKVSHLATQPFPIIHRDRDPKLHDELAARTRALAPGAPGFDREVAGLERAVLESFRLPPGLLPLLDQP